MTETDHRRIQAWCRWAYEDAGGVTPAPRAAYDLYRRAYPTGKPTARDTTRAVNRTADSDFTAP